MSIFRNIFFVGALLFLVGCSSFKPLERADFLRSDTALVSYLRSENIEVTKQNDIEFLNGGVEKFPRLFEDVRNAQKHIHLEYFNFRNDSLNSILISLLAEKAQQGVKVRANEDGSVTIELHIIVDNGVNLNAVCRSIMSEVRYVVNKTTGVKVQSVDVYVDSMVIG